MDGISPTLNNDLKIRVSMMRHKLNEKSDMASKRFSDFKMRMSSASSAPRENLIPALSD